MQRQAPAPAPTPTPAAAAVESTPEQQPSGEGTFRITKTSERSTSAKANGPDVTREESGEDTVTVEQLS